MAAIQKNLLFSLPDELVRDVFEFDPTYRIFGDPKFEASLQKGYFGLKTVQNICINSVMNYGEGFLTDGGQWRNEYGYFDSSGYLSLYAPKYESTDDFFVTLHPIGNVLYYKILPKGATKQNCAFLRNPRKFDGYFMHTESRDDPDEASNLCYHQDIVEIQYNVDRRFVMYF